MQKLIVIINGAGGHGKDTICDIVGKYYSTCNISSITPIKHLAGIGGWKNEKTLEARKLLSDLKAAFTAYNDLSLKYVLSEYESFLESTADILFVHIREGAEIKKFLSHVKINHITLLVKKTHNAITEFGNPSDDCIDDFHYDYTYINDKPLDGLEEDFMLFFNEIIQRIDENKVAL